LTVFFLRAEKSVLCMLEGHKPAGVDSMTTAYKVTHNEQSGSFEVFVEGHRAHLDYRRVDDSTLDFCHTFVPGELRGKGLAAVVTAAALEYARDNDLRVIPSCSYVEVYLKREAGKA
jgi:predicted GNAT family acetyltransferase